MDTVTVTFTLQEVVATRQMLDAALKAIGGQAAQAFLVIDGKFNRALQQAQAQAQASAQPAIVQDVAGGEQSVPAA